jgi:hypothetical protein
LVDSFYYYSPRLVLEEGTGPGSSTTSRSIGNSHGVLDDRNDDDDDNNGGGGDPFVKAACGSCFTLALTASGEVWSWGWNAFGVLGRGNGGFVSMAPEKVGGGGGGGSGSGGGGGSSGSGAGSGARLLGPSADRKAVSVACGANHALVLAKTSGAPRAAQLRPLLHRALQAATAPQMSTQIKQQQHRQLQQQQPLSGAHPLSSLFSRNGDNIGGSGGGGIKAAVVAASVVAPAAVATTTDHLAVVVENEDHCDVLLTVLNPGGNHHRLLLLQRSSQPPPIALPAHRVILEARCPYLRGLITAAANASADAKEKDEDTEEKITQPLPSPTRAKPALLEVTLASSHANVSSLRSLLLYLYCDRLEAPPHHVHTLGLLAKELFLDRLEGLCAASLGMPIGPSPSPMGSYAISSSSSAASAIGNSGKKNGSSSSCYHHGQESAAVPPSTFERDLDRAVGDRATADVRLYVPFGGAAAAAATGVAAGGDSAAAGGSAAAAAAAAGAAAAAAAAGTAAAAAGCGATYSAEKEEEVIWVHRVLLERVPFFETLLSGRFKEGQAAAAAASPSAAAVTTATATAAASTTMIPTTTATTTSMTMTTRTTTNVDVSGLVLDGCSVACLRSVIRFVYSGTRQAVPLEDPNAITGKKGRGEKREGEVESCP